MAPGTFSTAPRTWAGEQVGLEFDRHAIRAVLVSQVGADGVRDDLVQH